MLNLHRNKRSLTLNLKEPDGLAIFMRLVETADIVVENFRPDVKERLGARSRRALRGQCARHSCFDLGIWSDRALSHAGRIRSDCAGHGGLDVVTGLPNQGPVRAGIAVADSAAGIYAATGILIALTNANALGLDSGSKLPFSRRKSR